MMMKIALLIVLTVTITTVEKCRGHKINALYDTPVNFTCDPTTAKDPDVRTVQPGDFQLLWVLPTGEVLQAETLNHSRVAVLEGGRVLHVRKVDDVDFGVYYCLIYIHTVGRYITIQHGINVNGPYWGDLFLKYRTNLITGSIAGAVCFAAIGTLCFLYNRQQAKGDNEYESARKKKKGENRPDDVKPTWSSEYSNTAYVADEELVQKTRHQQLEGGVENNSISVAHAQSGDNAYVTARL